MPSVMNAIQNQSPHNTLRHIKTEDKSGPVINQGGKNSLIHLGTVFSSCFATVSIRYDVRSSLHIELKGGAAFTKLLMSGMSDVLRYLHVLL